MTRNGLLILLSLLFSSVVLSAADIVAFPSGNITLHGALYKPKGEGPFLPSYITTGALLAC